MPPEDPGAFPFLFPFYVCINFIYIRFIYNWYVVQPLGHRTLVPSMAADFVRLEVIHIRMKIIV
jgi:hypothetical protein